MASLYERRRARLGLEDDPGVGVGPVQAPDDALVGEAIESKLKQPPAAGAVQDVRMVGAPRPAVSKPQPVGTPTRGGEREVDAPGVGVPDVPDAGGAVGPDDIGIPTDETATGGGADFAQPRVTGDIGRVAGVDPNNWGNMESTKYRALEFIAAGEPITINNTARKVASPEFQAMFPGATFDGKDKIDFHGMVDPHSGATLYEVDVLQSADPANPDQELVGYWNDLTNDGGGGGGMDMGGGMGPQTVDGMGNSDTLAQIMAQIDAIANGQNPDEADALRRLLEQGGDNGGMAL